MRYFLSSALPGIAEKIKKEKVKDSSSSKQIEITNYINTILQETKEKTLKFYQLTEMEYLNAIQ